MTERDRDNGLTSPTGLFLTMALAATLSMLAAWLVYRQGETWLLQSGGVAGHSNPMGFLTAFWLILALITAWMAIGPAWAPIVLARGLDRIAVLGFIAVVLARWVGNPARGRPLFHTHLATPFSTGWLLLVWLLPAFLMLWTAYFLRYPEGEPRTDEPYAGRVPPWIVAVTYVAMGTLAVVGWSALFIDVGRRWADLLAAADGASHANAMAPLAVLWLTAAALAVLSLIASVWSRTVAVYGLAAAILFGIVAVVAAHLAYQPAVPAAPSLADPGAALLLIFFWLTAAIPYLMAARAIRGARSRRLADHPVRA
jgi:hypothetical protein